MNSRAIGIIDISGLLICFASALVFAQTTPSIPVFRHAHVAKFAPRLEH